MGWKKGRGYQELESVSQVRGLRSNPSSVGAEQMALTYDVNRADAGSEFHVELSVLYLFPCCSSKELSHCLERQWLC
jgi:hypothetical protein